VDTEEPEEAIFEPNSGVSSHDDHLSAEEIRAWQKRMFRGSRSDGSEVLYGRWGAIREDGRAPSERDRRGTVRRSEGDGEGHFRETIYDESKGGNVAGRTRERHRSQRPSSIVVDLELREAFDVLGVPDDSTPKAVKSAYRKLMKRHHPDVSSEPDAAEKTREVSAAYAVVKERGRV
jgi:DnaJ-class molecular chaperone